jgi:serine/threonine protein phosphatase PrpC
MRSIILYRQVILPEYQRRLELMTQVGTHSRDEPMKDAMSFRIPVEREDIVVLGSDGLMDNLVSYPSINIKNADE